MAETRSTLIFDVLARNRASGTFSEIARSTDTLKGKIAALGKLAAGAAAAGLAVFAAHGVRSFLEFDDKMTQSLAIMGEVSGPMRQRMEDAARAVGRTTRFGADQAAEAYFFLASAGLDAEQSVAAMPQVAAFAQAGMFDLARATDLATDAQSALGLTVPDAERNLQNLTHVTDVLVGANTLANASVEQFSAALTNRAGPALRAVNKPIEEGVAVLAAFADQGIKGQEAGTRLDIVMRDLQTRALGNKEAFEEANVAVFDQQGKMNNLGDIIGQLETRLGGMTDAQKRAELQTLGFTDRSIASLLALLGTSEAIKGYEEDLKSMAGVTEDVAGKQLESFSARLDIIKSRITDAAMVLGEVLVNAVFDVGETVGEMAEMFSDLPGAVQIGVGALATLAAGTPVAISAFRKVRDAVRGARAALAAMSATMRTVTLAAGGIGLALAAGATILAFFARQNIEADQRVEQLRESLDRQTGAITDNTREVAAKIAEDRGMLEAAEQLGIPLERVVDAMLGEKDAIEEVNAAAQQAQNEHGELIVAGEKLETSYKDTSDAASTLTNGIGEQNDELSRAQGEARRTSAAVGETEQAESDLEAQAAEVTREIEEQTSAIDGLISELDEMVSQVFAARDAERGFEQALDDAKEAAKENGATLDISTEKGRKNQEQLDRLAESALKDAAATLEDAEAKGNLAAGHDEATEKMQRAREEFIKVAREMGLSKKEAKALADELGLIPGNYEANIEADTSSASRSISDINQQLANIPRSVSTTVFAHGVITGQSAAFQTGGRSLVMQHGGRFRRGDVALVGEDGPELVRFDGHGEVVPNRETERTLRPEANGPALLPKSQPQQVELRISGDGPLFDMIAKGVRTGQLQLSANGAKVTVG